MALSCAKTIEAIDLLTFDGHYVAVGDGAVKFSNEVFDQFWPPTMPPKGDFRSAPLGDPDSRPVV